MVICSVNFLFSTMHGYGLVDWNVDWLVGFLGVCLIDFIAVWIIGSSVVYWVVHWNVAYFVCWVLSSLSFFVWLQPDLLQVSRGRNSSRHSWPTWARRLSGRGLPHCERDYPGYGLPLVQAHSSQSNFDPYHNRCERFWGIKFILILIVVFSLPISFLLFPFPVPSFLCILCFLSFLSPKCYTFFLILLRSHFRLVFACAAWISRSPKLPLIFL